VRVCAIETLYGEDSEEVKRIRCLRDTLVRDFPEIQEGVNLYYRVSPAIVALIEEDEKFKEELKWFVDGVICVAGARLMVE